MKIDDNGLTAAEGVLLVIIILLILSTGLLVFAIRNMGPENEPNLVIEDVYFKKEASMMKIDPYITNLGKPDAEAEIRWELTQGNRLITEGSKTITVKGRETYRNNFEIQKWEHGTLKITVVHEGNTMDTYTKQI
ncbi:MAG: hypothetical protein ACOC5D_01490 [Thermoplasmatota archaeon]